MNTTLKWMISALLLLAMIVFGLFWGIHAYGASALPGNSRPDAYRAPEAVRRQYLGIEAGSITELPKLNPITAWWNIYLVTRNDGMRRHQLQLLGQASRILNARQPVHSSMFRRQAAGVSGMVMISREWSLDEVVDTVIGESWYGRGAKGIESTSLAYFDVPLSSLHPEETLALLVLLRGPSYYDPVCKRERFEDRYSAMAERLHMDANRTTLGKATARMLPSICH
jgi:hypothetical protein